MTGPPNGSPGARRILVERLSVAAGDDRRSVLVSTRAADGERPVALRSDANLLRAGWSNAAGQANAFDPWTDATAREVGTIVGWSGTLGTELFADAPRNWLPPGRRAFDASLSALLPTLDDAGVRLLLQPHARHAINDVPSTLGLLRRVETDAIGIALAPLSLLTSSMLDNADEHLRRIFEALGPIASLLILEDGLPGGTVEDDAPPIPVPLGHGALPRDVVMRLVSTHVGADVPIVVLAHDAPDLDAAIRWIEA